MLVIQVFMALLFHVGNIGIPAMFLHNPFGTENGILIAVMTKTDRPYGLGLIVNT